MVGETGRVLVAITVIVVLFGLPCIVAIAQAFAEAQVLVARAQGDENDDS